MNAPLSASSRSHQPDASPTEVSAAGKVAPRAHKGKSWMLSLTGVCFVFGALVAMQLRATQQVRENRLKDKQGAAQAATLASEMKVKADAAQRERLAKDAELARLKSDLNEKGTLSAAQIAALNGQIKELQAISGLTPVSGPGVRITLSDNPDMPTDDPSGIAPGIVHDFDLQQVVNELRSAKADAIAIHGADGDAVRVTGYTPIRCVGAPILINWEAVTGPYTIEAIGNPKTLASALTMPGGIVENLKNGGAIGVKVETVENMELPAALGVPKMRVAKSEATEAEQVSAATDDAVKKVAVR